MGSTKLVLMTISRYILAYVSKSTSLSFLCFLNLFDIRYLQVYWVPESNAATKAFVFLYLEIQYTLSLRCQGGWSRKIYS